MQNRQMKGLLENEVTQRRNIPDYHVLGKRQLYSKN